MKCNDEVYNDEGKANKRLSLLHTIQKSLSTWRVMSADPRDIHIRRLLL